MIQTKKEKTSPMASDQPFWHQASEDYI